MDSKTTKSTLTHLFGESEPTKKTQYYDFLVQLISHFTITVEQLHEKKDLVGKCTWAMDYISHNGTLQETMYYGLLHSRAPFLRDRKQEDDTITYSNVLNCCLNLADDLIISDVVVDQYETLLSSLETLQEQIDAASIKVTDFSNTYQNIADQQLLSQFIQSSQQLAESHKMNLNSNISPCRKTYEDALKYREAVWHFAIGDHTIDTCWEELASSDSQAKTAEHYRRKIINLRLLLKGREAHELLKDHHPIGQTPHNNSWVWLGNANLNSILRELDDTYIKLRNFTKMQKPILTGFYSTIINLIDLSEQIIASKTSNSEPN